MKIVFVHDSEDPQSCRIEEALLNACKKNGASAQVIDVSRKALTACIGCFGCWIKTPGICIHIKDGGAEFLSKIYDADFLIFITKITWGMYSPSIKTYADRLLPLLHPDFVKRNGEMHHRLRYNHMPTLLAVGFGPNSSHEEETFAQYTVAHRDNVASVGDNGAFIWKKTSEQTEEEFKSECASWLVKETGLKKETTV